LCPEYPQLDHLPINYRKDLSSAKQIEIDLSDITESVGTKEADLIAIRQELALAKKKAKTSKVTARPQAQGAKVSNKPKQSKEDDSESVTKPRSLLETFVEASQNVSDADSEDLIPFDDFSKASTMAESQGEKRVHWDAGTVQADDTTEVTEKAHNLASQLSQPKRSSLKERGAQRSSASGKSTFGTKPHRSDREGILKDVVSSKGKPSSLDRGKAKDSGEGTDKAEKSDIFEGHSRSKSHQLPDTKRSSSKTVQTKPSSRAAFSQSDPNRGNDKKQKSKSSREAEGVSVTTAFNQSDEPRSKKRLDTSKRSSMSILKQGSFRRSEDGGEAKKKQSIAPVFEPASKVAKTSNKRRKEHDATASSVVATTKSKVRSNSVATTKSMLPAKRRQSASGTTQNAQESKRRRRRSKSSLFKREERDISFS
jgi:hypothetical protein